LARDRYNQKIIINDTLNRLTTLAPPSAFSTGSFGFSYDVLSRRTQMTRPNSVTTNYAYDNLSHLASVLHQLSGSTIDGASYTLDSVGNRTAKTDQRAAVTSNYTYDSIYQLLSAVQGSTTTESYTYDPVGNRTASLGVASYTTNASSELTAIPGVSYTYDSNGNTLTKTDANGTTTYAGDFENRLTSLTLPGSGGTVSFKYDPLGRRIYKSSSSETSIFAYDGDNLVEETNSSGAAVARYSQDLYIDEPLAIVRSSATSYYHADGLGSVTSLSNAAGSLAQTYTYDSFGKLTASSGSLTNPFQYTGRESDTQTGLYFYRARYYDPNAGRFISEDPIGFESGLNFYDYVTNDPTVEVDPSGNDGITVNAGGTFAIGGGSGNAGAGVAGNVSIGLLWGNPNGLGPHGFEPIVLSTLGAFAHGHNKPGVSFPSSSDCQPHATGFETAFGPGISWTNAKSSAQLLGSFKTDIWAIGPIDLQRSTGDNGVKVYSISAGWGFGLGHFQFYTNTENLLR
jgi:RHS repeat-associated protein